MRIEETIVDGTLIKQYITENSDLATQEQKDIWSQICNTCDQKNNDSCNYCGCILNTLMAFKTSKCPLNKW